MYLSNRLNLNRKSVSACPFQALTPIKITNCHICTLYIEDVLKLSELSILDALNALVSFLMDAMRKHRPNNKR